MTKEKNTAADEAGAVDTVAEESSTEVIQPENKDAPKPTVNFVNIPEELKTSCWFCLWKRERRKSGMTKVPYDPVTRNPAKTNDGSTFADFSTVMKAYVMGSADSHPFEGIGIRVADGIGAIDIDHCIREDGSLNDVAASILSIFSETYFERSPSGTGLRGFFKLDPDYIFDKTIYYINNRKLGLEVYLPGTTNRFVTVTGNTYRPGTVPLDMDALQKVLDSFMKRKTPETASSDVAAGLPHRSYLTDQQVIEHALNSSNEEANQRFRDFMNGDWQKYFDNQSDADFSFVSTLCFWCGCVEEQIDRIFRSSGMMRPKWDRKQSGTTYGSITIRNAIALCREIYLPSKIAAAEDFENLESDGSDGSDDSSGDGKGKKSVDFEPDLSQIKKNLNDFSPQSNLRYTQGEIGFGNLFADYYKPVARFNSDREVWYVYDGKSWRVDSGNLKVEKLAKRLADLLLIYGTTIEEESVRKDFIKQVTKLQDRHKRDMMIKDARSEHPLPHAALDRDEFLFNMQNGTMDLLTGEFHDHRPEDFITKISPVVYDPEATCERFTQFMDEVMQGDKERISYVQKALGYSLSADTKLECFFILYGATSRNGKGTLMETFLKIVGDYGKNSDPLLLAMKYNQNSSGPSEELARLDGARFVNISEPEKKLVVDAALTKRLTGNDTITARYLHENSFEFRPTFKIFINTNHEPQITDDTLFTSGRIKVIPFNRHFEEHEQDKGLKALFTKPENMSGIFNWLLEGFRLYHAEGLEVPKSVKEATDAYQLESDRIAQFVKQCLVPAKGKELRSQAVYNRYVNWCRDDQNFRPETQPNFKKGLERFYVIERRRPWVEKGGQTTMVNDVTWAEGEQPEEDLAPEN